MSDAVALSRHALTRAALPARAGVGFKPEHFDAILAARGVAGFFEVHAENYLGAGGAPHARLARLRAEYPLSIHGVGLSLGGAAPPDAEHLRRVKALIARYEPALFSEHLAWVGCDGAYYNDLLPLPYTTQTLRRVAENVARAQESLSCRIAIENPATYVSFAESTYEETAFLSELVRRTDCALLLDVANVYVSCVNRGADAAAYIDSFPMTAVEEIHLAGFAEDHDDDGASLLVDAHCAAVASPVWALYRRALARRGPVATVIEWDNELPDWPTLQHEASVADAMRSVERAA
jgi:uncharacterized protein (UPF0276 family)